MTDASVTVVTGAASGIGRATARALAGAGGAVVAVDRDAEGLRTLASEVAGIVVGDVANPVVHEEARRYGGEFGRVDGWVNCAAVTHQAALHELDPDEYERVVAANLGGVVFGCRSAVRAFLAHGAGGAIVNLSSVHARVAFPGWPIYDACKAGVEALTRAVCADYAGDGVRCNALAPGSVLTPGTRALAGPALESLLPSWERLAPAGRLASADEIAAIVQFLLSPAAAYVNGAVIVADGGMTAVVAPRTPEDPT